MDIKECRGYNNRHVYRLIGRCFLFGGVMNNDRYRDKVRKLLALAESDNPHEAERALAQAKAIMAKYNIAACDTEIIEVKSSSVPRPRIKDYENHLIQCIKNVSGCEAFLRHVKQDEGRIRTFICFIGLAQDANMAAYSMDVLHSQLKRYQLMLKEKHGMDAGQRNLASFAWVVSACEKLTSVFDYKEIPDHVADYFNRGIANTEVSKNIGTKSLEDQESDTLFQHGYAHGIRARLEKAVGHQAQDALE